MIKTQIFKEFSNSKYEDTLLDFRPMQYLYNNELPSEYLQ